MPGILAIFKLLKQYSDSSFKHFSIAKRIDLRSSHHTQKSICNYIW